MIVYKVTNNINGKIYIGKTSNSLDGRKAQHLRDSKKSKFKFHRALKKYGYENFLWEVVFECHSEQELNLKEIELIQNYNSFKNGYNMTLGGEGQLGNTPSEKTRSIWSLQRKGVVPWNKGKKNLNSARYNKIKLSKEEINESRRRALKGRIPWNKGKKIGTSKKIKNRVATNAYQVIQIDNNGNEIIWNGFSRVEKHFKCGRKAIYNAILNNVKFKDSYWKANVDVSKLIRPVKDK